MLRLRRGRRDLRDLRLGGGNAGRKPRRQQRLRHKPA